MTENWQTDIYIFLVSDARIRLHMIIMSVPCLSSQTFCICYISNILVMN